MNCIHCGRDIPDVARVCPYCGRAVQGNIPAAPGPQATWQQQPPQTTYAPPYTPAAATYAPAYQTPLPAHLPSGNDPAALPHVQGWNWGGFFLSWMWALGHERITAAAIILITSFVPFVRWGFKIYFGIKGNELAWTHRRFRDLDEFRSVQRAWMIWGAVAFGLSMLFWAFYFTMMIVGSMSNF